MKRGVVKAMPTQQVIDSNGMPRVVRYSDIFGLSKAQFIRPLQPEIVIDLDKLDEINISKATGVRKESYI
jgi:hypothetical protein